MSRAPLTILIVEDNADFASMLSDSLRGEGHDVHVATTGADGIELAKTTVFDAVLLDLNLGDMSGYEVALELRKGALPPSSIVVVLTGTPGAQPSDAECDMVLGKPINFELMDGLVRQLLSLRIRRTPPVRE